MHDTALLIGRFEPVHSGHLALLQEALRQAPQVIVVVGSAWQPRSPKNPFTWQEREAMLRDDHATAHTAAHVDPEDALKPSPCSPQCLSQGGHIGIVLHSNGHSSEFTNPVSQREIMPARHLMRATNLPCLGVDRPAETHAH